MLRLGGGAAIGLALAAPVLVVFREYVPLSFNAHSDYGSQPVATDPISSFLNWMMPRISRQPQQDTAFSRNWIGAAAMYLAFLGLATPRGIRRRHAVWPIAAMGALLTVVIYGGDLVQWTRHIPIWNQAIWPYFGTPIIACALALLAGVGVQALVDRALPPWRVGLALGILVVLSLIALFATHHRLAFGSEGFIRGGWPVAFVCLVGVVIAAFLSRRLRAAPFAIVAIVILELLAIAPHNFYAPRTDPFPQTALTKFLVDHTADGSRVFSTEGLLYPDTANAYGIADLRAIDALYPDRYLAFVKAFVAHGITDRWVGTGKTESFPNVYSNTMFDLLGGRYLLYRDSLGNRPPAWAKDQFRLVFHGDGVRVYENLASAPRGFVVPKVETAAGRTAALQKLVSGEPAYFPDGSLQMTTKDPRKFAVVESGTKVPSGKSGCVERSHSTRLVSIDAARLEFDVDSRCGGLLVVNNQYYPGWKATVDGKDADIHATDVTLQGVSVPAGRSTVVLTYAPSSFKLGLVGLVAGIIALLVLLVTGIRASHWWRRRRGEGSA